MKRKILALLLMSASFTACKKCDPVLQTPADTTPGTGGGKGGGNGIAPGGCIPPQDCDTVICTMQFAGVMLFVQHANGTPVALDSFVVTDLAGAPLPAGSASGLPVYGPSNSGAGQYVVVNDFWVPGNRNNNNQVIAKGFIGGAQVFSEPYTILADCCHVSKAAGKDTLTLP